MNAQLALVALTTASTLLASSAIAQASFPEISEGNAVNSATLTEYQLAEVANPELESALETTTMTADLNLPWPESPLGAETPDASFFEPIEPTNQDLVNPYYYYGVGGPTYTAWTTVFAPNVSGNFACAGLTNSEAVTCAVSSDRNYTFEIGLSEAWRIDNTFRFEDRNAQYQVFGNRPLGALLSGHPDANNPDGSLSIQLNF